MTVVVDSIMADRSALGLSCDTDEIVRRELTCEALRFREACRVELLRGSAVSDDFGYVSLKNWTISNGPQGIYSIYYATPEGVRSKTSKTFFSTPVAKLIALNKPPGTTQYYGIPLTTQPKIRILDEDGYPIANKTVVAISWPEPYFNYSAGVRYYVSGMNDSSSQ